MKLELKPFITLMRRVIKCHYPTVFLSNRMLMQCYNIDHDSDVGLHYVLPIPPTDDYSSPFYDFYIELSPKQLLDTYNAGHKYLQERKSETTAKPKDLKEELYVTEQKGYMEFKFLYYIQESLIHIETCNVTYPVDPTNLHADNCVNTYVSAWDRVKYGGRGVLIDGIRTGIVRRTLNSAEIYYHVIKMGGKHIRIPFIRSMFLGTAKWDRVIISIQETELDSVYLMGLELMKNGIIEIYFGYVQNW